MDKKSCVKCHEPSDNGLPLCCKCRTSLKDFVELAKYLNGFNGDKDALLWIISSEISNRESSIINNVKFDSSGGVTRMVPIKPSGSTIRTKPWLWDKYVHIEKTLSEIDKLRKAQEIVIRHYGS